MSTRTIMVLTVVLTVSLAVALVFQQWVAALAPGGALIVLFAVRQSNTRRETNRERLRQQLKD